MKWLLEWGEFEEGLENIVISGGQSKALESKPTINGLEWLWNVYWELDSCRVNGMSLGKIPWTAIMDFVDRYKLTEFEEDVLKLTIRTLDTIRLEASKS